MKVSEGAKSFTEISATLPSQFQQVHEPLSPGFFTL